MKKADYSKIAASYDNNRFLSEQNVALWLGLISKLSKGKKGARTLDLGCGTGRFAIPMAEELGFKVIGADLSKEMLAKAREKDRDQLVMWETVDACSMKYHDNSFDMVFMSHLLHHVDNPYAVVKECKRVLRPNGTIVIRYGTLEQIQDDQIHTFFPEVMALDLQRTPTRKQTERFLTDAGFINIISEEVIQQTYKSTFEQLRAIQGKNTSALNMISEKAFEMGIRRLIEHINQNPNDQWLLFDKMTLTVGFKGNTSVASG